MQTITGFQGNVTENLERTRDVIHNATKSIKKLESKIGKREKTHDLYEQSNTDRNPESQNGHVSEMRSQGSTLMAHGFSLESQTENIADIAMVAEIAEEKRYLIKTKVQIGLEVQATAEDYRQCKAEFDKVKDKKGKEDDPSVVDAEVAVRAKAIELKGLREAYAEITTMLSHLEHITPKRFERTDGK